MLEASTHSQNCFVTLTYDDEHLPKLRSLRPAHSKAFMNALKYRFGPTRYYLTGEYGSSRLTTRPHYHALLFGQNLSRQQLEELWQRGSCHSGTVTPESARYVAGYINKVTKPEDLHGRFPEYSRMSRRPGIGFSSVEKLVTFHQTKAGVDYLVTHRDVIGQIRQNGQIKPLGRYIVRKTREALGVPHSDPLRPKYMDSLDTEARYLREDLREVASIRSKHASLIPRDKL